MHIWSPWRTNTDRYAGSETILLLLYREMESNEVATQDISPITTSGEKEDQHVQTEGKAEAVTVQDPGDKAEASKEVNKISEENALKVSVDSQDVDEQARAGDGDLDDDFIQSLIQNIESDMLSAGSLSQGPFGTKSPSKSEVLRELEKLEEEERQRNFQELQRIKQENDRKISGMVQNVHKMMDSYGIDKPEHSGFNRPMESAKSSPVTEVKEAGTAEPVDDESSLHSPNTHPFETKVPVPQSIAELRRSLAV